MLGTKNHMERGPASFVLLLAFSRILFSVLFRMKGYNPFSITHEAEPRTIKGNPIALYAC
jgi:hypothetical protein